MFTPPRPCVVAATRAGQDTIAGVSEQPGTWIDEHACRAHRKKSRQEDVPALLASNRHAGTPGRGEVRDPVFIWK